ncbi:MAG: phospholipase D-like domain-containing protein [Nocardioidaceae bacterium]
MGRLLSADAEAGRVLATTIVAYQGETPVPVYVHAKVAIIDDRWLTIGSANLNEHSLFNDTEMNVLTSSTTLARNTRLRLWAEHTERPVEDLGGSRGPSSTRYGALPLRNRRAARSRACPVPTV